MKSAVDCVAKIEIFAVDRLNELLSLCVKRCRGICSLGVLYFCSILWRCVWMQRILAFFRVLILKLC